VTVVPLKSLLPASVLPRTVKGMSRTNVSAAWLKVTTPLLSVKVPSMLAVNGVPPLSAAGTKSCPVVVPFAVSVMVRLPPAARTSGVVAP